MNTKPEFTTQTATALYDAFEELVGFIEENADGMMKMIWRSAKAALGDNIAEYFERLDEDEDMQAWAQDYVRRLASNIGVIDVIEPAQSEVDEERKDAAIPEVD